MFVIINRVKGSWNISLCLPARLPCPIQREETNTAITIHVVPWKEGYTGPPWSNASLVSRSDRKTFVSCHSLVTKLFLKAPEKLDAVPLWMLPFFQLATRVMLFAQKKKPFHLAAYRVWLPGPLASFRSVWTQVASRSDYRTRPILAAPVEQIPDSLKKRSPYWGQRAPVWRRYLLQRNWGGLFWLLSLLFNYFCSFLGIRWCY